MQRYSNETKRKRSDTEENSLNLVRKTENMATAGNEEPGNTKDMTGAPIEDATLMDILNAVKENKETIEKMTKNIVEPIVASIEEKIKKLETNLVEKDIRIRVLEDTVGSLKSKITYLEEKIENSYKEKNIIIDGMKEEKNENVQTLATDFLQNELEINLKDYEVNEAFRVGTAPLHQE